MSPQSRLYSLIRHEGKHAGYPTVCLSSYPIPADQEAVHAINISPVLSLCIFARYWDEGTVFGYKSTRYGHCDMLHR